MVVNTLKNRDLLIDKKELEMILEKIPRYPRPKKYLEQYETPSSIVAHILWIAFMNGDLDNSVVIELGCGMARFSIGALILGASKAICVDVDEDIVEYARRILSREFKKLSSRLLFLVADVADLQVNGVDVVIMNPPFGVVKRNRGLDLLFLRKALLIGSSIYTIHKYSDGLNRIVGELVDNLGYNIIHRELLDFPIPMMFTMHRRKVYRVKTIFYVLRRGRLS